MQLWFEFQSWLILAQQDGGEAKQKAPSFFSPTGLWLPLFIILILFYFMMIRPEKRRKAEAQAMLESMKKNDRIVTIGGIMGTIISAPKGSPEVTIRIDETNNTKIRVLRTSIARVLSDDDKAGERESESAKAGK